MAFQNTLRLGFSLCISKEFLNTIERQSYNQRALSTGNFVLNITGRRLVGLRLEKRGRGRGGKDMIMMNEIPAFGQLKSKPANELR